MASVKVKETYAPKGRVGNIIITEYQRIIKRLYGYDEIDGTHYELCLDDNTLKPWKKGKNRLFTYFKTYKEAFDFAHAILKGKEDMPYTDAQRAKYVTNYNNKHNWGFSKHTLLATMRMHQNGDSIMKRLMEDRLEDANFHCYSSDLNRGDYGGYMQRIEKEIKLGYL